MSDDLPSFDGPEMMGLDPLDDRDPETWAPSDQAALDEANDGAPFEPRARAESDEAAIAASPLGAIGTTYYRTPDALTIRVLGKTRGVFVAEEEHERVLLDELVYALAGRGAREER